MWSTQLQLKLNMELGQFKPNLLLLTFLVLFSSLARTSFEIETAAAENGHQQCTADLRSDSNSESACGVRTRNIYRREPAHCPKTLNNRVQEPIPYNGSYPLTQPVDDGLWLTYRIAIVTDLDHGSKSDEEKHTWYSYLRFGNLSISHDHSKVNVSFEHGVRRLKSTLSQGGRSMELSDLKIFNGELLTIDDRTGIIYKINLSTMNTVPWLVLPDGDGSESKGFKGEWLAVKDNLLYVGGLGKEWTTLEGEFINHNPMWVKVITYTGQVLHVDWVEVYRGLRAAADIHWPGYMIHESAQWSEAHQRWFFFPRRASTEAYAETADERRGTNYMLVAKEDFSEIELKSVTPLSVSRGFSAFQFIPGTQDSLIVAIKSEEDAGNVNSYVTVFNINGEILIEETKLEGNFKYEGIEFV